MILTLQVATTFLVSIAWALALSHALEWPGKLRLSKEAYIATQPIYYPGFTIGAAVGEAGGIFATLALVLLIDGTGPQFALMLVALVALLAMHGTYWVLTHPVNKFWVRNEKLGGLGAGFFGIGERGEDLAAGTDPDQVWTSLRNRWEASHAVRAAFAGIALLCLIISGVL